MLGSLKALASPRHCASRMVLRYAGVLFIVLFLVANYALWRDSRFWDRRVSPKTVAGKISKHPIRKLMVDAKKHHEALLAKRSRHVDTAAARYRERRGRHPPPGFDKWFRAAQETDAVIVEDFFDRIYKDLTPFWALDPLEFKKRANAWHHVVKVRNGTAMPVGDVTDRVPWLKLWTDLVAEFAKFLPDVDMPINYMDESRLLVPHDTIAKLVAREERQRTLTDIHKVTTKFQGLMAIDAAKSDPYEPKWFGLDDDNYWNFFVRTCGPNTPAYGIKQVQDMSGPVEFPADYRPSYAYKGYVHNFTAASNACLQPHLRQMHGTFIEPLSLSSAQELIPLFGGSKLPMNNEILIPGAMYLDQGDFYSGGASHGPSWDQKKDGTIWRGDASGGRAKEHNWWHYQRQRLVQMLNSTVVAQAEESGVRPLAFELPSPDTYPSPRLHSNNFADWVKSIGDAAFIHLCAPDECHFYDNVFTPSGHIPMQDQYTYKFLPDIDGNSFSARYRGFLRSTSLPLKATIYAEWHDDRLQPWVHFVPLDNSLRDLYPVLDYFSDHGGSGDTAARFIAEQGQAWSEKVLRREDMRLYVWRLLLEWARVCDENRHTLGFVDDLKTTAKRKIMSGPRRA